MGFEQNGLRLWNVWIQNLVLWVRSARTEGFRTVVGSHLNGMFWAMMRCGYNVLGLGSGQSRTAFRMLLVYSLVGFV